MPCSTWGTVVLRAEFTNGWPATLICWRRSLSVWPVHRRGTNTLPLVSRDVATTSAAVHIVTVISVERAFRTARGTCRRRGDGRVYVSREKTIAVATQTTVSARGGKNNATERKEKIITTKTITIGKNPHLSQNRRISNYGDVICGTGALRGPMEDCARRYRREFRIPILVKLTDIDSATEHTSTDSTAGRDRGTSG